MSAGVLLPLTAAQSGMWFAQQLDEGNATFVTGQYVALTGPVDVELLRGCVDRALGEVPELGARIVRDGDTVRQEPGAWALRCAVEPLGEALDPAAADAEALRRMRTVLAEPVDLTAVPGFGATLYVLGTDRVHLFLRAHHVLLDVYGYTLLERRIAALYAAARSGTDAPAARFARLDAAVAADVEYSAGTDAVSDRDFWSAELASVPEAPTPADSPPPPASWTASSTTGLAVTAPAEVVDRLDTLARASGGTWVDVVTAAVAAYLARVGDRTDVVVGFPSMNRIGTPAAKIVTTAVNVLPLRVRVDPGRTLLDLAGDVRSALGRHRAHTRYRAEDIHRDLRLPADSPGIVGPSVNVKPFGDALRFGDVDGVVHSLAGGPVRDLAFVLRRTELGRDLEIRIDADADRYTPSDLSRHAAAVVRILTTAADSEGAVPVGAVDLSDPQTRREVLRDVPADVPASDVTEAFDEQVRRRGEATALVDAAGRVSYAELARRVDDLAGQLAARGAGPETLVALALPRTADMVVSVLAVLRAGAAYVPVDPQFPQSRLDYMLADARPAILLTTAEFVRRVSIPEGTRTAHAVRGGFDWADGATGSSVPSVETARPETAAYTIYTSGSTGKPKGVVIERKALARFVCEGALLAGLGPGTTLLAVTTLSFDIAVLELIAPLTRGGDRRSRRRRHGTGPSRAHPADRRREGDHGAGDAVPVGRRPRRAPGPGPVRRRRDRRRRGTARSPGVGARRPRPPRGEHVRPDRGDGVVYVHTGHHR
ncbi:AMP-binding protein [Rhodococcus triatomae]|nr:AMP-binding protein [Rhodococcus triatomae]